jgi:rSAM/selenodomain-associated transferase 2
MIADNVSIIIPVLNELVALQALLPELQASRQAGHEIIVVDGGSTDGSISFARTLADRLLMTGTGRARQMNLGAENARHDILLFLHADSRFPQHGIAAIQAVLNKSGNHWGRFDVTLDGRGIAYAVIAAMMNLRSRITGVATGDQGMFVRRSSFHGVGGFQSMPLMEDIALSKTLRRQSWPVCLPDRIVTSARRWQQHGITRTILLMWKLRLAFFLGGDPEALARRYYPTAPDAVRSEKDNV